MRCTECGEGMQLWYSARGYREWFCEECEIYYEYVDGELSKKMNLSEDVKE